MDGWEKWPDGHLKLGAVIGWETATTPHAGLVRMVYGENATEMEEGGKPLQLALTVPQVEQLIRDLSTTLAAMQEHEARSAPKH